MSSSTQWWDLAGKGTVGLIESCVGVEARVRQLRGADQSETFERRRGRRGEATDGLEDRTTFVTAFIVLAVTTLAVLTTEDIGLETLAVFLETGAALAVAALAVLTRQWDDRIGRGQRRGR